MPAMPDMLMKPTFLSRLDDASQKRRQYNLDLIINELKQPPAGKDFVDVAIKYNWLNAAEATHLRTHWMNKPPGQGWWPTQPVEDILRVGLTKTVELVKQYDLPIDSYWLCTEPHLKKPPPNSTFGQLYVFHIVSPLQITVLFSTPSPDMTAPQPTGDTQNVWVTLRAQPPASGAVVRHAKM